MIGIGLGNGLALGTALRFQPEPVGFANNRISGKPEPLSHLRRRQPVVVPERFQSIDQLKRPGQIARRSGRLTLTI
jgi:hypothetical protein